MLPHLKNILYDLKMRAAGEDEIKTKTLKSCVYVCVCKSLCTFPKI